MTHSDLAAALHDPARVAAARATGLMDAPPHPELVLLARLAARATHAPIAWVALLDDRRHVFQAARGLPAPWRTTREIPAATSICLRTVAAGTPLRLDDVAAHPDPAVAAAAGAGIGAYLGVPLRGAGPAVVGTVCVADRAARRWSDADVRMMADLAREARWVVRHAARAAAGAPDADGHRLVLGFVAHDLRNPLHVILLAVQMARDEAAGRPPAAGEPLRLIERAAARMARLVEDLLDETALESGRLRLARRPCRPRALLHAAVAEEAVLAAGAGLALEVAPSAALPAVCADRSRVLQVLANLVDNAIKFTPAGGRVVLAAEQCGREVRFQVRDSGPGIDPAARAHLFDPFWQARPDARGIGLGLAIARGLVEAHGGRMWADAGPGGHGTAVSFSLPMARPAEA